MEKLNTIEESLVNFKMYKPNVTGRRVGEIRLADELRDNFPEEGRLPLVLKEGYI